MFCRICGSKIPEGYGQCPGCGAKVFYSSNQSSNQTLTQLTQPVPLVYNHPGGFRKGVNGLGIAGFIVGILSIVLFWIPYLNLMLSVAGFIISLIAVNKKYVSKGFAIAGLILSILGILLGFGEFLDTYRVFKKTRAAASAVSFLIRR